MIDFLILFRELIEPSLPSGVDSFKADAYMCGKIEVCVFVLLLPRLDFITIDFKKSEISA